MNGEIILYTTEDGGTQVSLREIDGSVWLSQADMAELFQTTKQSISQHISQILDEGELLYGATVPTRIEEGKIAMGGRKSFAELRAAMTPGQQMAAAQKAAAMADEANDYMLDAALAEALAEPAKANDALRALRRSKASWE